MSSEQRCRSTASIWLAAVLLMACGCSLVVSFDSYGTTGPARAGATPLHAVGGQVDGLGTSRVKLHLSGATVELGDGPFAFPAVVAEGDEWAVRVDADPALHSCSVERGSGTMGGADVTDVAVHCPSSDATLQNLVVSAAPLAPAFVGSTLSYRIDIPTALSGPRTTTVTATPKDGGARVAIAGTVTSSGKPSTSFELLPGPNAIDVAVTARDGRTKTHYTVVITVRDADYLKASNTQAGAGFGHDVALSGNTLAVSVSSHELGTPV